MLGVSLAPSLIWGLQEAQGLRVVPVFLYRYSMRISLKKARSPARDYREWQIRLGTRVDTCCGLEGCIR
jgi:hypothetical protein